MALNPGTHLGPYEITALIGAGGMGEVYRAEDSTLKRHVAIKVLPAHLLDDPERLARFEREAQVLASLNHPNIAAVYGLEESEGHRCLVMELVEGEDLAQRLQRGPVPPDDVVSIARQVAEALEAAHESGVIHRDLKPANIKLRPDGRIKVLDFGLAKAVEGDPTGSIPSLSSSPTLTGMMTGANVILGTAAYMSPEQARGQVVDKRSDIWAFGCVLFELLGGKQAFQGDTISDTLASVLKSEPDWSTLPTSIPANLRRLMERCLVKDPRQRLRDIGEARIQLEAGGADPEPAGVPVSPSRRIPTWAAGLLALAVVVAAGAGWFLKPAPHPTRIHGAILLPEGRQLMLGSGGHLAFSPDGGRIAFAAADSNEMSSLWIRNLTDAQSHELSGTDDATNPFWSPDGKQLGFFADGKLKKIPVSGGAPIAICDAEQGRGGQWREDGTIVFAPHFDAGLFRVNASGGVARPFRELGTNEFSYRWPQLIGDRGLLLTVLAVNPEDDGIFYQPAGDSTRLLIRTQSQAVFRDGLLYYMVDNVLFARRFDADRGDFTGDPETIVTNVRDSARFARGAFTVAAGGQIAYVIGRGAPDNKKLVRYTREGGVVETWNLGAQVGDPALSPDGTRLAFSKLDRDAGTQDVWILDLTRNVQTRLTFAGAADDPVWSPDGTRLTYAQDGNLYVRSASGVGDPEQITDSKADDCTHAWSADGRFLTWSRSNDDGVHLWVYDFETSKERQLLLGSSIQGEFSPDGRWIAYVSDESGQNEIYVQDFPDLHGRWQVSGRGGVFPRWGNGEIVYRAGDRSLVTVKVEAQGADLRIGQEAKLFQTDLLTDRSNQLNVNPEGDGIWIVEDDATGRSAETFTPIRFILNWRSE